MAAIIPSLTDASNHIGIYIFIGIIIVTLLLLAILADRKFNKKEK